MAFSIFSPWVDDSVSGSEGAKAMWNWADFMHLGQIGRRPSQSDTIHTVFGRSFDTVLSSIKGRTQTYGVDLVAVLNLERSCPNTAAGLCQSPLPPWKCSRCRNKSMI